MNNENLEKIAQIWFETFNVWGLFVSLPAVLSLFASGRSSGVVVDSGFGVTDVVPINEGRAVAHAMDRIDVGGDDVTVYLRQILSEDGYSFATPAEREIVNYIKESLCYVAGDFEKEMLQFQNNPSSMEKEFELPSGSCVIKVRSGLIKAAEALFKPRLIGKDTPGLHTCVQNSIMKCFPDDPHPKYLYPNILLAGGNTMFDGFSERLKREIAELHNPKYVAKVIDPPERKYSAWIGGALLAQLPSMGERWVTKKEYGESGSEIVLKKWKEIGLH